MNGKLFEQQKNEVIEKLDSADTGKHPTGALILAVTTLLEIVEAQNKEIENLNAKIDAIVYRETLQPAFHSGGGHY